MEKMKEFNVIMWMETGEQYRGEEPCNIPPITQLCDTVNFPENLTENQAAFWYWDDLRYFLGNDPRLEISVKDNIVKVVTYADSDWKINNVVQVEYYRIEG